MKKIDFGSDESFIQNYEQLKSSRKMAQLYNCNKTSILNHAKKIGYNPNSNKDYKLTEQNKQYIRQHYYDMSSSQLAEYFNVSRGMITKIWYDANLSGKEVVRTPKDDLTNQRFGRIIALYPTNERTSGGSIKWMCQCDCGNKKTIAGTDLKNGKIKSCGCLSKEMLKLGQGLNLKDLTAQQFGKLTVIKRCEDKIFPNGRAAVQWLCACNCGRQIKVLGSNLITGNSQSCGLCGENSHGNLKIDMLLSKANIPFQREKRFETCKDNSYLPFDFYVNNAYLIEYDGNYHFDNNHTVFDTKTAQKHDTIKTNWCISNNIPLIRIPYTHYNDLILEDLLLETSSFIVNK